MLARRPAFRSFRWLALGFLVVLPIALALIVRERASWRPRTLETGLVASRGVSVSRDGQRLALLGTLPGNRQMALQVWDLGSRLRLSSSTVPHTRFEKPVMSPDNSLVLCSDMGLDESFDRPSSTWIFNARSGKLVRVLKDAGEVAFVPDGSSFYVVNSDGSLSWNGPEPDVRRMDARTLQVLEAHDVQAPRGLDYYGPFAWDLAPDCRSLAFFLEAGVLLVDLPSGQRRVLHGRRRRRRGCVPSGVAVSRDHDLVAAANGLCGVDDSDESTLVQVWHRASGRRTWKWEVQGEWTVLGFSPDGSRLLMWGVTEPGGGDYAAILCDVRDGRTVTTMHPTLDLGDCRFSPDGAHIATTYSTYLGAKKFEFCALLWDARTGKIARRLIGHRAHVNDVAWSPDGSTLATASFDGTVKLWRVR